MRELCLLLLLFSLLSAACAGGSSRYGCPAESGRSCKSVSEVYAEAVSGGGSATEPFRKAPENGEDAHAGGAGKRPLKGKIFRGGKDMKKQPGGKNVPGTRAEGMGAMPVYLPPTTIRLWIAPWQDSRGVFHSEKYVYMLSGRGRWRIGGKTVPLGAPGGEYPESIPLRAAGRDP